METSIVANLLGLGAFLFMGFQTWWDFAEGRVKTPFGIARRNTSPWGFWLLQIGRVAFLTFVAIAVAFTVLK